MRWGAEKFLARSRKAPISQSLSLIFDQIQGSGLGQELISLLACAKILLFIFFLFVSIVLNFHLLSFCCFSFSFLFFYPPTRLLCDILDISIGCSFKCTKPKSQSSAYTLQGSEMVRITQCVEDGGWGVAFFFQQNVLKQNTSTPQILVPISGSFF